MKKSLAIVISAACAVAGAALLVMAGPFVSPAAHSYLSSFPLALTGLSYALLQIHLKPARTVLLKRLVLAAAFLLWAVDQLLPPGRIAVFLGDVVVGAYVLDLFWMIQDQRD